MSEECYANVYANVFLAGEGGWQAGDSGTSTVGIYYNPMSGLYRIVALDTSSNDAVINAAVQYTTIYVRNTDTFHQFTDQAGTVYGLNFSSADDAEQFGKAAEDAIAYLTPADAVTDDGSAAAASTAAEEEAARQREEEEAAAAAQREEEERKKQEAAEKKKAEDERKKKEEEEKKRKEAEAKKKAEEEKKRKEEEERKRQEEEERKRQQEEAARKKKEEEERKRKEEEQRKQEAARKKKEEEDRRRQEEEAAAAEAERQRQEEEKKKAAAAAKPTAAKAPVKAMSVYGASPKPAAKGGSKIGASGGGAGGVHPEFEQFKTDLLSAFREELQRWKNEIISELSSS